MEENGTIRASARILAKQGQSSRRRWPMNIKTKRETNRDYAILQIYNVIYLYLVTFFKIRLSVTEVS